VKQRAFQRSTWPDSGPREPVDWACAHRDRAKRSGRARLRIYSRLLRDRSVFIVARSTADRQPGRGAVAVLDRKPGQRDRAVHQPPGGSVYAGMAIYDTMQCIKPSLPICVGWPPAWAPFCSPADQGQALRAAQLADTDLQPSGGSQARPPTSRSRRANPVPAGAYQQNPVRSHRAAGRPHCTRHRPRQLHVGGPMQ